MNMEIKDIDKKIITQIDDVLYELEKARENSFTSGESSRRRISKAEGILETIKIMLE